MTKTKEIIDWNRIKIGVWILVEFGRSGSQVARVVGATTTNFRVEKWRRNSRSFTKPVLVPFGYFIRFATAADLRRKGIPADV